MADQGTQGLLSPWLRQKRIAAAAPFIRGNVLDVGCGSGALASIVSPENYTGYDIDSVSLSRARTLFPDHRFVDELPPRGAFDCVISLAVIEHLHEPEAFLMQLAGLTRAGGKVILTTPNPKFDFAHHLGSNLGLFSHDASEEHVSLLDRTTLSAMAEKIGLSIVAYKRFLLGANQLLVTQKA